jgi:hypothetical protein
MNVSEIMNVLIGQLASDNPGVFEDSLIPTSDQPAPPLINLIRHVVADAVESVDDDAALVGTALEMRVWQALTHSVSLLGRASAALMLAATARRANETARPRLPIATVMSADVTDHVAQYLISLRHVATTLARHPLDPMHLPVTMQIVEELDLLPPVFAFLAQRRCKLRTQIHPNTAQYGLGQPLSDYGADRADAALSYYTTVLLGIELSEEPENWSLRDQPDMLRQSMKDILCDLHHLANAAEIIWKEILAEGERSYREEL